MGMDTATPPMTETGRDRILREAAELFLTRGYAETSLRTIADAVDMRPASIYHHFDSKDALLTDCLLYTSPSPRDQRGSRMPSSA